MLRTLTRSHRSHKNPPTHRTRKGGRSFTTPHHPAHLTVEPTRCNFLQPAAKASAGAPAAPSGRTTSTSAARAGSWLLPTLIRATTRQTSKQGPWCIVARCIAPPHHPAATSPRHPPGPPRRLVAPRRLTGSPYRLTFPNAAPYPTSYNPPTVPPPHHFTASPPHHPHTALHPITTSSGRCGGPRF